MRSKAALPAIAAKPRAIASLQRGQLNVCFGRIPLLAQRLDQRLIRRLRDHQLTEHQVYAFPHDQQDDKP